jgi:hypothetical protein
MYRKIIHKSALVFLQAHNKLCSNTKSGNNTCISFMQAREFSSELRAGSKASKSSTPLFEGPASANQSISITDTTADAYYKMITVFIPLLVDEVSFV